MRQNFLNSSPSLYLSSLYFLWQHNDFLQTFWQVSHFHESISFSLTFVVSPKWIQLVTLKTLWPETRWQKKISISPFPASRVLPNFPTLRNKGHSTCFSTRSLVLFLSRLDTWTLDFWIREQGYCLLEGPRATFSFHPLS